MRRSLPLLLALLLAAWPLCAPAAADPAEPGTPTDPPVESAPQPAAEADPPAPALHDALVAGRYDEADNGLTDFLRKNPNSVEARLLLARAESERGRLDAAESQLGKVLELDPACAAALCLRGEIRIARGRPDDGERDLAAALAKEPDHLRARYARARLHLDLGLRDQAVKELEFFFDYYDANESPKSEDLLWIARAVWLYGVRKGDKVNAQKVVSDLLPAAVKLDRANAWAFAFWGACYLEKYDFAEAVKCFDDALKINPNLAYAHYGRAAALAEKNDRDAADRALARALAIDPVLVDALVLSAAFKMQRRDYEEAVALCEKALKVNPRSLPALGHLAACHWLLGEKPDFAEVEKRALAVQPAPAEFYYLVGDQISGKLLFVEGQDFFKKAVACDPNYWAAQIGLGLNHLRLAEEAEGKRILEKAFERDPFHVWTRNTLKVLDALETEFTTLSSPHFTFKLNNSEKDLIEPYARDFAEECFATLAKRYGFKPETPILLEMYPQHADLSVRTFGLGGLGILGACFGKLVVLDSPKAQEVMGPFNWASVLWHELAHVFHLQLSNYKVPRWFTEGLATYEEKLARPGWDREMEIDISHAYHAGALPPIAALDKGSTGPAGDLVSYYYYGCLISEYIHTKYGFEKLVAILKLYGEGKKTPEVFRAALGVNPDEFDATMQEYVKTFLKDVRLRKPFSKEEGQSLAEEVEGGSTDGDTLARFAQLLIAQEKYSDAQQYAMRALEHEPDCAEAYVALGDLYGEKRPPRAKKAIENYEKAIERGNADFQTRMRLAGALAGEERIDEAIARFEEAKKLFPKCAVKDQNPYSALIKLYEKKQDGAAMLREMEALAAIDQGDFPLRMKLAKEYRGAGRTDDLIRVLTEAIFIQPVDVKLHAHLGGALKEKGRLDEACREFEMTVILLGRVNKEGKADALVGDYLCEAAAIRLEQGRREEAAKLIEDALTVFPGHEKAQKLRGQLDDKDKRDDKNKR
ncbi:MAG: tetratricopeptide repeat protein [Planctomycetes bacterium]|nr:tetratricopeptide repeat protein [Planctomycetota bacterium]